MQRRAERGETVRGEASWRKTFVYTRSGAGELFQAMVDGQILSSALVMLAEKGGVYKWGGTSPEGMAIGASHFLLHEVSRALKAEGKDRFNLGAASDPASGLWMFKARFGGAAVDLEAATFYLGNKLRRAVSACVSRLRGTPA